MSDVTDVVKALTELASQLRARANLSSSPSAASAYHDAAGMVDAVMIGPAMQSALDELDRREYREALRGET